MWKLGVISTGGNKCPGAVPVSRYSPPSTAIQTLVQNLLSKFEEILESGSKNFQEQLSQNFLILWQSGWVEQVYNWQGWPPQDLWWKGWLVGWSSLQQFQASQSSFFCFSSGQKEMGGRLRHWKRRRDWKKQGSWRYCFYCHRCRRCYYLVFVAVAI